MTSISLNRPNSGECRRRNFLGVLNLIFKKLGFAIIKIEDMPVDFNFHSPPFTGRIWDTSHNRWQRRIWKQTPSFEECLEYGSGQTSLFTQFILIIIKTFYDEFFMHKAFCWREHQSRQDYRTVYWSLRLREFTRCSCMSRLSHH